MAVTPEPFARMTPVHRRRGVRQGPGSRTVAAIGPMAYRSGRWQDPRVFGYDTTTWVDVSSSW